MTDNTGNSVTHTKARQSHPSACVSTGHSQLHARLHPALSTGPQTFKALKETLEFWFFSLLASLDAAQTLAAGKGELTDTLGCTNLSWCAEGLQALADCCQGPQLLNVVGLGA